MSKKLLQFIKIDYTPPAKRPADARGTDFDEIYAPFPAEAAEAQASRCSQCGVPFCQQGCPLQNNIPDWLMLAAQDRLEDAYRVSSATNTFPEICGRICPQDRLCEGICTIEQSGHGTVTIGAIEKYITENAWNEGWVEPIRPPRERTQSVGIIGAGPGGLAAAEMLRRRGYQVTVYDRYDRMGGLMTYGIPGFKLEKPVVMRRIDWLADGGVNFVPKCDVGVTHSFADLRASHDAMLIATGVYKPRELKCPGTGGEGVHAALDYLIASNRAGFGDVVPQLEDGTLSAKGRNVVVVGGGDTAMDCVRTAVRQGAKSVTCLYRRDRANMPGSQREVNNAEEEGVVFEWLSAPEAIVHTRAGRLKSVRVQRMKLGAPDASGRQAPVPAGDSREIRTDMVIKALGFDPEDLPRLFNEPSLAVNRWGAVSVDYATMMVNGMHGVFAAGDIVRGASLVVWAIKDGRDAAEAIHNHLKAEASAVSAAGIAAE